MFATRMCPGTLLQSSDAIVYALLTCARASRGASTRSRNNAPAQTSRFIDPARLHLAASGPCSQCAVILSQPVAWLRQRRQAPSQPPPHPAPFASVEVVTRALP